MGRPDPGGRGRRPRGSAIGRPLLQLCARAFPIARRAVPGLRMDVVCGPRVDPGSVAEAQEGLELHGYVPDLHLHFAASDLAVVQGGGTTTLELTALRRPFLYFPLAGHFEQQTVVGGRLSRQGAGVRMDFARTSPASLAEAIATNLGREAGWPPIRADGAHRAAAVVAELLGGYRGPRDAWWGT